MGCEDNLSLQGRMSGRIGPRSGNRVAEPRTSMLSVRGRRWEGALVNCNGCLGYASLNPTRIAL
jgi:hypothetical protein